jgi:hypothetical protein
MTSPVATTRQTPAGIKLKDGHGTKVTFAADPDISFWEVEVKPPGMDGGDAIEQTTHHNTTYRTKAPQALIDLTDGEGTCQYDPNVAVQVRALINVETTLTIRYPDGSTDAIFGYLKSFEPDPIVTGEPPQASFSFVATNVEPGTSTEEGPTFVNVAGT